MTRLAALLALLFLLALPVASAQAEPLVIGMPGKLFDPVRAAMVSGDTVVFRNTDFVPHDVRIADGLFDSGPIARSTSWAQTIEPPGAYPFVCTLHPFMSGNLDVLASTLATGAGPVLANEPVELSGRTRAGTPRLTLERSTPEGDWIPFGGVVPAPDGSFRTTAPAVEGAGYRVSTPAGASPVVTPQVTARVELHLDVRRSGEQHALRVHTVPAAPAGFVVTLERYSRWRYAWRGVRSAALDVDGAARFRVRGHHRSLARISLARAKGGPALGYSRVVRLHDGRTVPDPDALAAPPASGHPH